jgi:hypothetical protein
MEKEYLLEIQEILIFSFMRMSLLSLWNAKSFYDSLLLHPLPQK